MTKWFEQSMFKAFDQVFSQMQDARQNLQPQLTLQQIGTVQSVTAGIAIVIGLTGVYFEELLMFTNGIYGTVFNLDNEEIAVVLLGDHRQIRAGDKVLRTRRVLDIAEVDE